MLQKLKIGIVDKIGGFLAILCAIHCIVLPIFLSMSGIWSHGIVETLFLLSAIVFTLFSLRSAYIQKILVPTTAVLFIAGIICILLSIPFHLHSLSGAGGVLLSIGHFWNWRLHRSRFHA